MGDSWKKRGRYSIIVFFIYLYIHILYQTAPHWYIYIYAHLLSSGQTVLRNGTTVAISQSSLSSKVNQVSEQRSAAHQSEEPEGGSGSRSSSVILFGETYLHLFVAHQKKNSDNKNCQRNVVSPLCFKNNIRNIRFFEPICSQKSNQKPWESTVITTFFWEGKPYLFANLSSLNPQEVPETPGLGWSWGVIEVSTPLWTGFNTTPLRRFGLFRG